MSARIHPSHPSHSPALPFSSPSPRLAAASSPSSSPSPQSETTPQPASMPSTGSSLKKRHVCGTCQKAFTTSGHLSRHARVHTGERNHKCPFPGCETRCSRQDNLQQHYRIHLSPGSRRSSGSAPRTALARALGTEGQPTSGTKRRSKYHLTVAQTPVLPVSPPSTPPALEQAYQPASSALAAPDSPPALTPAYRTVPLPTANEYPSDRPSSSPDAHSRPFASGSAVAPLRPSSVHQASQSSASFSRVMPGSMHHSDAHYSYQGSSHAGPSGSSGVPSHGMSLSAFDDYGFGPSAGGSTSGAAQHSTSHTRAPSDSMLLQFDTHVTFLPSKQQTQAIFPTARSRISHSNSPSPVSSVSPSSRSSGYSTPPIWSVGGSPGASPLVQSSGLVYTPSPELSETYSTTAQYPIASTMHAPLPVPLHEQYNPSNPYPPGLPFEDTTLPNSIFSMPGWEAAVADASAMRKMSYETRGRGRATSNNKPLVP